MTKQSKLEVGRIELDKAHTCPPPAAEPKVAVERAQLNVRVEKRMLKVLKAMAEYYDITLTQAIEDIILHAFEGVSTFDHPQDQERIKEFKRLYEMNYDVHDTWRFTEKGV